MVRRGVSRCMGSRLCRDLTMRCVVRGLSGMNQVLMAVGVQYVTWVSNDKVSWTLNLQQPLRLLIRPTGTVLKNSQREK